MHNFKKYNFGQAKDKGTIIFCILPGHEEQMLAANMADKL